jgi:hypothetical protein
MDALMDVMAFTTTSRASKPIKRANIPAPQLVQGPI